MNITEKIIEDLQYMDDWMTLFILFVIVFIGVLIGFIISEFNDIGDFYKKGQIDALNGKIHYEKYEHENGEITWEKK